MRRSTWDGSTVVYRYGCPAAADRLFRRRDGEPDPLPLQQLRLAQQLWNRLVEIDRAHEERVEKVWAGVGDLADPRQRVADAEAAVEQATKEVKAYRKRYRTTRVSGELRERAAAARAERREARAAMKAAKRAADAQAKPDLAEAETLRRAEVKATYAEFAQATREGFDAPLFWATYNRVVGGYDTARRQVISARAAGKPAQLRFHRWDGEGTLSVQLQRQSNDPLRSPALLASGEGPWRNVAQLRPWRDPADGPASRRMADKKGVLTVRIASGRPPLELPVMVHRHIPAAGDITDIEITRRRTGPTGKISVAVTVRLPAPVSRTAGQTVAVAVTSRAVDGDEVKRGGRTYRPVLVAEISTDGGPLPAMPDDADLRQAVRLVGWDRAQVILPAEWRAIIGRDAAIQSVRDDNLEGVRDQVVSALRDDPGLCEHLGVVAADVARGRAARQFVALAQRWPVDHPLAAPLREWARQDRHLWDFSSHERDQIIGTRRHLYRVVAAWLCVNAAQIVVDGRDLRRRRPDVTREDPHAARAARAQAAYASPGELRDALRKAAERRGMRYLTAEEGEK